MTKDQHFFFALGLLAYRSPRPLLLSSSSPPRLLDARLLLGLSNMQGVAKDRHFFFALGLLALQLASTIVVVVAVVIAPRLLDDRQLLGMFVSDGRAVAAPPPCCLSSSPPSALVVSRPSPSNPLAMRPPRPIVLLLVAVATARVPSVLLMSGVPYSDAA